MALLTNKPLEPSLKILELFGLSKYFRWVVGGDGPWPRKPAPDGMRYLMGQASAGPHETTLIGDSTVDLQTSRNAGVRVCLARYGFGFVDLPARLWTGERDGANPYLAFLAHAQRIVVTPDSVNLASEACATGKPVYVHMHDPVRGKLARFHDELVAREHARPLARFDPAWAGVPLRETQGVADEVWRRIRARS